MFVTGWGARRGPTVWSGEDGAGAELGHIGDQSAGGRRLRVLTELAALCELIVVASPKGIADAGPAQQPRDMSVGVSPGDLGQPDQYTLGRGALASDGDVLAGVPRSDRGVGEVGDPVGDAVGMLALSACGVAVGPQRVGAGPGAGGIHDRTAQQPLVTFGTDHVDRSEEHTSELQSLMRISYAV